MSLGETAACLSRNLNSYLLALPTASCNSRLWRDLPTTATQLGEKNMASLKTGWNSAEHTMTGCRLKGVLRHGKQRHVSVRRRAS